MEKATFGAGCFWGVEAEFRKIKGVKSTAVGYEGGHTTNPTYQDVCTDKTGHAEVVEVEYDPNQVSYEDLLNVFWKTMTQRKLTGRDPITAPSTGPLSSFTTMSTSELLKSRNESFLSRADSSVLLLRR